MKIIFFANSDWYLYNFRVPLAQHIKALGVEIVMISPPGEYAGLIEAAGFRWVQLDMSRRSTNPFGELAVIWRLRRILRDEKPDLIHNFTIKSVVYGAIAARLAGVRHVVNAVAGLGFVFSNTGLQARLLKPVVRVLLRFSLGGKSSRLILQNPDDQALFARERLLRPENVRLVKGSGVNTERFHPPESESLAEDGQVKVLMASRLLWDKGLLEYVEAAKAVRAGHPEVTFWLAGSPDSGNPNSVTDAELDTWREQGFIEPVGHVEDMVELLGRTDIVVLPTRYGEGVPRVLIESAAAGLPLVGTDVPGCREIIKNEINGFLVEPNDVTALVNAIVRLVESATLRHQMGKNGRGMVLQEFDEKVVFSKTLDVYRELVTI